MEDIEAMTSHEGTYSLSEGRNYRTILLGALKWIQQLTVSNEDPHARPPPPSNQASNPITEEQNEHNVQLLTRLRTVENKYQNKKLENESEEEEEGEEEGQGKGKGKGKAKGKGKVKGKGKGRDDSKEVATDYTPKMTPMALATATASRNSTSTPSPSSSFVASNRTYADVLSPGRPSSAIRRRPNFGSLPQDE
jgi:hypothetical protein